MDLIDVFGWLIGWLILRPALPKNLGDGMCHKLVPRRGEHPLAHALCLRIGWRNEGRLPFSDNSRRLKWSGW